MDLGRPFRECLMVISRASTNEVSGASARDPTLVYRRPTVYRRWAGGKPTLVLSFFSYIPCRLLLAGRLHVSTRGPHCTSVAITDRQGRIQICLKGWPMRIYLVLSEQFHLLTIIIIIIIITVVYSTKRNGSQKAEELSFYIQKLMGLDLPLDQPLDFEKWSV